VKYFAYGSNLSPAEMRRMGPAASLLGRARLDDHRLAFTRRSPRRGGGVADVVPGSGLRVWGALYEVDDRCLERLDRKEGHPKAYVREEVSVRSRGGDHHRAITYMVARKEEHEITPTPEYLALILSGARACRLPAGYIRFLASIVVGSPTFRSGLVVRPSRKRPSVRDGGIARVAPSDATVASTEELALVHFNGRRSPARLLVDGDVPCGVCELDQALCHALDVPRETRRYGEMVTLSPFRTERTRAWHAQG
jgi:gamma-glutamylcyclotransferase (GGCT)/AIG2-like uncharacterized protein YtfP